MTPANPSDLIIRTFEPNDTDRVIHIWSTCGLVRSWNNPILDIKRKASFQNDLFFVGLLDDAIIATAMFGYDGHRGSLNYFAVLPDHQGRGFAKQILSFGEARLIEIGCPKINLHVRHDNESAAGFYGEHGFHQETSTSLGKRLIED